ncbi:hypothetical protein [Mycoplasmopsis adleri]
MISTILTIEYKKKNTKGTKSLMITGWTATGLILAAAIITFVFSIGGM